MQKVVWLAGLMLLILSACKKSDSTTFIIPDGVYKGTFQRQVAGEGEIANVMISFSSGKWSGESEIVNYPALCNGTYQLKSDREIFFQNSCAWTANFDWTIILADTYKIRVDGKDIELSKDYNGAFQDIYKLRKQ